MQALLSIWNYYIYWWRSCKFISVILSADYKTGYKIVKFVHNIIPNLLGTPTVGLQGSSSSLKGRSRRAISFLSLRRSAIILITPPFALRSIKWGFWGPQQGNAFSSLNIASCRPRIKYQERSVVERELEELNGFSIIFSE